METRNYIDHDQPLFNYLLKQHGLILVQSELDEVVKLSIEAVNNYEVQPGMRLIYKRKNNIDIAKTPALTLNNLYIAEKVRFNYRGLKIAIAIRDDRGKLRWYSFNKRYWEKQ